MEKEIKVIEAVADISIVKLPEAERKSIFERIAAETPELSQFYFMDFHDGLTAELKFITDLVEPDIFELKLRKTIELSRMYTPIIPLLENLSKNILIKRHRPHSKSRSSFRSGGAAAIALRKDKAPLDTKSLTELSERMHKQIEVKHKIRIVLDWIQPAERLDRSKAVIPSGENTFIVGMKVIAPEVGRFTDLIFGNFNAKELVMCCGSIVGQPVRLLKSERLEFTDKLKQIVDNLYQSTIGGYRIVHDGILHPFMLTWWKYSDAAKLFHTPIKIVSPVRQIKPLNTNINKFIEQMNTLLIMKMINDEVEVVFDVIAARLYNIYYYVMLHGANDKYVLNYIDQLKRKNALLVAQKDERKKRAENLSKLNLYQHIIEQKIGEKKYADIYRGRFYANKETLLQKLSAAERKIVEEEYSRLSQFLKAAATNKCPHVKLLNKSRRAKSNFEINGVLRALEKFFVKPMPNNNFITCRTCGFDIMCPHVLILLKSSVADDTFHITREKLAPFIMMKPGATSYFCKICGENLSDVDIPAIYVTEETASMQHSIDDELRRHIWGEMVSILQRVKFTIIINPSKIIDAMIAATYEFIFEIEKQLLKSRTNTADDVKRRLRLFITIYGYTYLVKLVQANMKKPPLEFKGMKPTKDIVDYLKFIINDIINTRNVLLSKLGGLSTDFVKNKVIEAFKAIGTKGDQTIRYSDIAEEFYSTMILDPFYAAMHMYYGGGSDRMKNTEKYLGDTIDGLAKATDTIYAKAKPLTWKIDNDFAAYTNQAQSAKDISTTWFRGIKSIKAASFNFTLDWIKKKTYLTSWYTETEYSQTALDLDRRADELKSTERILYDYKNAWLFLPIGHMPYHGNMNYVWRDVGLALHYDEKGRPHVFDVYVFANGKTTLADANANVVAGKQNKYKVTDRICSICGVTESKAIQQLDNNKIVAALNARAVVENFLRMYETRCPEGGVHDYVNAKDCRKCKMPIDIHEKPDLAIEFYNKYKKTYEKDLKRAYDYDFTAPIITKAIIPLSKSVLDMIEQYSYHYDKILELANKLKVNVHAFASIGATENINYDDILSGKYISPEPEEKSSHHLYKIISYVYELIREYNQLRHSATFELAYDLQIIVENSGIKKHELGKLLKMPSVAEQFTESLTEMTQKKTPKRLVEFAIESLATKLFSILTLKDPQTQELRAAFVVYFVKKILKSEELTSQANLTLWALFRRGEHVEEAEAYESNYDYDHGLETEDSVEKDKETNEDYGTTDELFSMDAYDIDIVEGSPDNLDDNNVKTDGYGLD